MFELCFPNYVQRYYPWDGWFGAWVVVHTTATTGQQAAEAAASSSSSWSPRPATTFADHDHIPVQLAVRQIMRELALQSKPRRSAADARAVVDHIVAICGAAVPPSALGDDGWSELDGAVRAWRAPFCDPQDPFSLAVAGAEFRARPTWQAEAQQAWLASSQ